MSKRESGLGRGPEIHGALAYLSRPLYPLLRRVQIRREGRRKYEPSDILLPEGYVAEVVATGFKTPVHCCFDDRGFCYVTESATRSSPAREFSASTPRRATSMSSSNSRKSAGSRPAR